jgi:hypothetical protein
MVNNEAAGGFMVNNELMPFDPQDLLAGLDSMPLVRRRPEPTARGPIAAAPVPELARAGLYLYAGLWDEAHEVAQSIETRDGSYWHAIVHRQEPDAGNASYWFRQVGQHPIFPELAKRAAAIEPSLPGTWDPYAFIDYCERAARNPGSDLERRAIEIQQAEWELLFDYCLSSATRG